MTGFPVIIAITLFHRIGRWGQLSLQILADPAVMSVQLERVFMRELGVSPGRYVRQMRIEAAQRMFERTRTALEQIALGLWLLSEKLTIVTVRL